MTQPARSQCQSMFRLWGTVTDVTSGMIRIAGISAYAGVGNEVVIRKKSGTVYGEVLSVSEETATASLLSSSESVRIGDIIHIEQDAMIEVGDHMLGQVLNYRGEVNGNPPAALPIRKALRNLYAPAPPAYLRKQLGDRVGTGMMVTDTILPLCQGQRMGLFAGSGVGKSTLLANLANGITADRVVIGLIGERSREVNEFITRSLSPELMERAVVVAATASEPPGAKKRAAYCAVTIAEYFRDQGHEVLLVLDSITRFAEAHRETALLAGEAPALNAFPPSTVRVIAELVERTGPGIAGTGDITAIYSVLVAGSDFEEPVADMIRGILDGHIVLSRTIAERGRYPAVDVLRSVSRCLPRTASDDENQLIRDYRRMIALHEEVSPMLRANLYEFGKDHRTDRAIELFPALDEFAGMRNAKDNAGAFAQLAGLLGHPPSENEAKSAR